MMKPVMLRRVLLATLACAVLAAAAPATVAQSVRPARPYSVLTAGGRQPLAAVSLGDQEMVRLDDLAALFQLTVREDRAAKALTVTAGARTVVLALDQGLASIAGRLVSLPSPPARDGARWLVPPEFAGKALPLIIDTRVDLRRGSRLLIVGELRVPRVTARTEQAGGATRVTLDVSPRAIYNVTQEPRRLVIAFDADALDAAGAPGQGLVEQIGTVDPSSIVLHLAPGAGPFRATAVPLDAASSRVVIDVMAAGSTSAPLSPTAVPPTPAPQPAEPATPLPAPGAPGLRTVVIDPGHGGDEAGARGQNGAVEKDITLDVARRLKGLIEGRLGLRVLLTRDDDRLVPLDERAAIANNNKADLFISIHANASPRRETRGAEVFYLSLDGFKEEMKRAAENPQGRALPVAGAGSRDVQLILWEMAQARHMAESAVFAGFLEEELRRRVEMSLRPIQQAPFRVLVAANMPAVLVEMAFLSNAEQETQLGTDEFKNQIVQGLFESIVRYRARIEGARRP
jgi:N-acetylmuramoyl-L-alanine amidase